MTNILYGKALSEQVGSRDKGPAQNEPPPTDEEIKFLNDPKQDLATRAVVEDIQNMFRVIPDEELYQDPEGVLNKTLDRAIKAEYDRTPPQTSEKN